MRPAAVAALVVLVGATAGDLAQSVVPPWLSGNLDDLVKVAANTCEVLPLEVLFEATPVADLDVVEFRKHAKKVYKLSKAHRQLRDKLPPTLILYIPGWLNTPTDESTEALVKALLHKNPLVLVLDTRTSFYKGYVSSASSVNGVGQRLYKFVKNIHRDGFPLSSIHIIGFSLGAHAAGVTGKLTQKHLKGKLERITALDPARPCFSRLPQYTLNKTDAKFVQVVHTSTGVLGIEQPLGHTDVYANGVTAKQPECAGKSVTIECDHAQSWRLFSASVMDDRALMGRRCWTWTELSSGNCSGDLTAVGYSCSAKNLGMYLYKSTVGVGETPRLRVFNPLDIFTWFS